MKQPVFALLLLISSPVYADPPVVKDVEVIQNTNGLRFDVTLSHPDTGWEHYADGWRVSDMNGNELGLRVLVHPHVTEQPFTRSLGGIQIPDGIQQVRIQARCLIDGWNAHDTVVTLP